VVVDFCGWIGGTESEVQFARESKDTDGLESEEIGS
jgi:hypothetical protein